MPCTTDLNVSNFLAKCTFKQLKQIHAFLILTASITRNGLTLLKFLRRSTEFGSMEYPDLIFTQLGGNTWVREISLWNVTVRGYAFNGPFDKCVSMFVEIPLRGLEPNNYTYPYVLNSCCQLGWYRTGETVHCRVIKTDFETAFSVADSLFNFYVKLAASFELDDVCKTERINDARRIFDDVSIKPVELSNSIIADYLSIGDVDCAREVFDDMPERDVVSWNTVISDYARVGVVASARHLFDGMPEKNVVSWTSMIRVYTDTGDFENARDLFEKMPERNVVSWNSMISGYTQNGKCQEALDLFAQMQLGGINPDGFTFVSTLSACAQLGVIDFGKWLHYLIRDWSDMAVVVGTALVEMYTKCGDVNNAFSVFIKIPNKDVFCYNVIIKSLAIHGRTEDAMKLFYIMQRRGLRPNDFTFSSILSACSHGGLVEEGRKIFASIEKQLGTSPTLNHYGCFIDLLCRNGLLEEAGCIVNDMPYEPDMAIQGSMLRSCLVRGDIKVAERIIEKACKVEGNESRMHVKRPKVLERKWKKKTYASKQDSVKSTTTRHLEANRWYQREENKSLMYLMQSFVIKLNNRNDLSIC